jgi:uncharacterized protein YndB with AHSA1/START domain
VITIAMSTRISATPARVWRALTSPSELVAWDTRILAPVEIPDRYPFSGQHMRWRYRIGGVQVVMHDRPLEVSSPERLRRTLQIGSLRYEQTFQLTAASDDDARTLLGVKLVASNSVPVIGDVLDRFDVRRFTTEHVDETLRAIQNWCESNP